MPASDLVRLGPSAQRRLAVVLADVFGEPEPVALEVASFLDGYLGRVPLQAALGLRVVVWAITWLPIVFIGVPLTVNRLSPAARARYLARWSSSKVYFLREGFYLLKAISLMGWGAQPEVRARLGLPPVAAERA
jgi:hypothetical protein